MTDPPDGFYVFDRRLVRRRRDRAAAGPAEAGFLFAQTGRALLDRLDDVTRPFAEVLELGCRDGGLTRALLDRTGVRGVVACDLSPAMAAHARACTGVATLAADEEALPFAPAAFDLVIANLSLHWVNDLPGALIQLRRALRPEGLLLATLLGGDTLVELRRAVMEAELALTGGASPRLSPVIDPRDAAGLMQRAGFALPVVDTDSITVTYANAFSLLADLRAMGETHAAVARNPRPPSRALWPETVRRYHALFAGADGRVPATFEVITLTGWASPAGHPQPHAAG